MRASRRRCFAFSPTKESTFRRFRRAKSRSAVSSRRNTRSSPCARCTTVSVSPERSPTPDGWAARGERPRCPRTRPTVGSPAPGVFDPREDVRETRVRRHVGQKKVLAKGDARRPFPAKPVVETERGGPAQGEPWLVESASEQAVAADQEACIRHPLEHVE